MLIPPASLALHTALFVRQRGGLVSPSDSSATHSPTPNKDPFRQSLCGVEWRQETVIPLRLGRALHGAAHYQAEMAQPRLLRLLFLLPGLPAH